MSYYETAFGERYPCLWAPTHTPQAPSLNASSLQNQPPPTALQRALRHRLRSSSSFRFTPQFVEYVKTVLHGWIRSTVRYAALVLGVTFLAAEGFGIIWTTWAPKAVEKLPGRRARWALGWRGCAAGTGRASSDRTGNRYRRGVFFIYGGTAYRVSLA